MRTILAYYLSCLTTYLCLGQIYAEFLPVNSNSDLTQSTTKDERNPATSETSSWIFLNGSQAKDATDQPVKEQSNAAIRKRQNATVNNPVPATSPSGSTANTSPSIILLPPLASSSPSETVVATTTSIVVVTQSTISTSTPASSSVIILLPPIPTTSSPATIPVPPTPSTSTSTTPPTIPPPPITKPVTMPASTTSSSMVLTTSKSLSLTANPSSSFTGEINVVTTDSFGVVVTLTSVSYGEVVTATNVKGQTFITTYKPDGRTFSRTILLTTDLPDGTRRTVTSYVFDTQPPATSMDAAKTTPSPSSKSAPQLQSVAPPRITWIWLCVLGMGTSLLRWT